MKKYFKFLICSSHFRSGWSCKPTTTVYCTHRVNSTPKCHININTLKISLLHAANATPPQVSISWSHILTILLTFYKKKLSKTSFHLGLKVHIYLEYQCLVPTRTTGKKPSTLSTLCYSLREHFKKSNKGRYY
jgi:hypothetical protein